MSVEGFQPKAAIESPGTAGSPVAPADSMEQFTIVPFNFRRHTPGGNSNFAPDAKSGHILVW